MDMDVGDDLILGWEWISSYDLRHLYVPRQVGLQSRTARLQLDLLPAALRPPIRALAVIGHGEFQRLLRQIERADAATIDPCMAQALRASPIPGPTGKTRDTRLSRWSTGWSRPVAADHTEIAALEGNAQRQAARACRRPGAMPVPPSLSAGPARTLRRRHGEAQRWH